MKTLDTAKIIQQDSSALKWAAAVALFFEFAFLTAIGVQEHWLAHPQKTTGLDESKFIAAEVFEIPKKSHLTEEKKAVAPKAKEVAIRKTPSEAKPSAQPTPQIDEQNQTDAGPTLSANHGPVAINAPVPVIPPYLQDKDLSSSVVIEFLVNNQGQSTPHLIGSSGNEELDAIAVETAKKWQFRPAEQNHKPIDSKVRLRINFQVH